MNDGPIMTDMYFMCRVIKKHCNIYEFTNAAGPLPLFHSEAP